MKSFVIDSTKWILNNLVGVVFIVYGLYLMSTKEWKLGGIYLLFFGLFLIQREKIKNLEERIIKLENKE